MRLKYILILSLLVVCVFIPTLSAVAQSDLLTGAEIFDGENALQHVANHLSVGPRPTGSPEIILAGNIILSHLQKLGWQIAEDWHMLNFGKRSNLSQASRETLSHWNRIDFGALIEQSLSVPATLDFDLVLIPVRNLIAEQGTGNKVIIIGAHYDSRILSDKDNDPSRRTLNMPGANDGGSGVGVLLELARVISQYYTIADDYTIRLVFFDAEDNGRIPPWNTIPWADFSGGYLIGSILYAAGLDLSTENIEYMILVDLVGDIDQKFPIEYYSYQSAPQLVDAIWAVAAQLGYAEQFPTQPRGSAIIDDHLPFIRRGIPAVDIIDLDYPYWDTSEDTLDKLSAESLARVGHVLQTFLEQTGVIKKKEL